MQEKGLHICQLTKTVRNNLESFHEFGNMQIIQRDLSNPSSMTKMEVTGTIFCQVMFNTTGDWWLFQVPQRNPHPCREDLLSVTFLLVSWEAFWGDAFLHPTQRVKSSSSMKGRRIPLLVDGGTSHSIPYLGWFPCQKQVIHHAIPPDPNLRSACAQQEPYIPQQWVLRSSSYS